MNFQESKDNKLTERSSIFPKRKSKIFATAPAWLILAGLVIALALLVIFAPQERTLGDGIKIVYVHVAVIWTAMLAIAAWGLLGLGVAFTDNPRLYSWLTTMRPLAFGVYLISAVLGMVSSKINWGAVGWLEPRMQATLSTLAVAVMIMVLNAWLSSRRIQGVLGALMLAYTYWAIFSSPLVLHPENPIMSSDSGAIKLTFFICFALVLGIAAWILWYLQKLAPIQE
ncbi:MAG: hypothetical protein JXB38_09700 [Anaerolineales bacterium]|nr:hypothetical protein [Anaerolineales bacterium]